MHDAHARCKEARKSGLNLILNALNAIGDVPAPGAPSPVQRPPGVIWISGDPAGRRRDDVLDLLDKMNGGEPIRDPFPWVKKGVLG